MIISNFRIIKAGTLALLVVLLASCGLPRFGPNKSEILKSAKDQTVNTYIVAVDERVTRAMPPAPSFHFDAAFINAHPLTPDLIRPGDTLSFTVYENVDDGLFVRGNPGSETINPSKVDDSGFIFIPYAGRIRVMGNTPERVRQIVTERLADKTPEPQVVVQRTPGDGGTVSVIGSGVAGQGTYTLQRSNLRLTGLLAAAGGITGKPEVVRVVVIRDQQRGEMWYEDIYKNQKYDIALRPGDRIIVEEDVREFTALGATGSQNLVAFESQTLTALEALARVGGLSSTVGDPSGIFVIRDETAANANAVLGRSDFTTEQRLIYLLNLTEANGLFFARNFKIQDGDTVYVTEAPLSQWNKSLRAITGTLGAAQVIESVVTN